MSKTRVVYIEKPGKIQIKSENIPKVKPTQVLIKSYQASICGSERWFYKGITVRSEDEARGVPETQLGDSKDKKNGHSYPMGPLGHEGGGIILEKGNGVNEYVGGGKVKIDQRVASLVYPTFTDYWVTDIKNVQPIPERVSFEIGCLYEPLGCAVWAARHACVKLGDIVAIIGVGFAGNILMQGAIRAGASKVIAIDIIHKKLQIAKQLGADFLINPKKDNLFNTVMEITKNEGVDVAIEAVGGNGEGIKQALKLVKHNGIIDLYGDNYAPVTDFCFHRFHEDGLKVNNLNAVHYNKLRSIEYMREAYKAIERGVFNVDIIFENSETYPLEQISQVFKKEKDEINQNSLKTFIKP